MTSKLRFIIPLVSVLVLGFGCNKDPQPEQEQVPEIMTARPTVYKDQTVNSAAMNRTVRYSVWLPPTYDETKTYPVLYLLHGAENDNPQWNMYDATNAHTAWLEKGDLSSIATRYARDGGELFIIVSPNGCPDGQNVFYVDGDQYKYATFFLEEFIPHIESKYHGNGKRAIAGLSMGGFGTLYHCLLHPEKWTYAYAMSPATWWMDDMVKHSDPSKLPGITIEMGTEDATVSPDGVEQFHKLLEANNIKHEYITRSGGHTWTFWQECLPKALKKVGESFK